MIRELTGQQVRDAAANVTVEIGALLVASDNPREHEQMLGVRMHRHLIAISKNLYLHFRVIIGVAMPKVVFKGLLHIGNIREVQSKEPDLLGGRIRRNKFGWRVFEKFRLVRSELSLREINICIQPP